MSGDVSQYPWLFKGAYAIYSGASKVKPLPGEVEITSRINVEDIDLANKRVKLRIHSSAISRVWRLSKKISEEDVADWVKIGDRVIPSDTPYVIEEEYEGVMRFSRLGMRRCIAQLCSLPKSTMIVLWDKEFNWPLEFISIFKYIRERSHSTSDDLGSILRDMIKGIFQMPSSPPEGFGSIVKKSKSEIVREYSIVISLNETNIPGLKC